MAVEIGEMSDKAIEDRWPKPEERSGRYLAQAILHVVGEGMDNFGYLVSSDSPNDWREAEKVRSEVYQKVTELCVGMLSSMQATIDSMSELAYEELKSRNPLIRRVGSLKGNDK